ncbi:MAG: MFS transporter [Carbonactinosporaceae bacterium]
MGLFLNRDFRLLWAGETVSKFGSSVTLVALPLLAVTVLHATTFQVGLLTASETVAFLVVGLPAGAWVDRMRHRNVLVATDLGRTALLGSLPLAALLDVLTLTQLYLVALAVGVLTVFFDVAYQSYLPHLVGRDHLVEGNAKLQASESVAQLAGPGVGGLLVQVLTAPYALAVDAMSFLWSAGCVALIRARQPKPERAPGSRLVREVAEGLRFVFGHRLLRAIAGCTASANLFTAMVQPMLIVLLSRELGLPAGMVGLFFTVSAAGGVLGALLGRRIAGWLGQGPAIWVSIAASSPFGLLVPLVQDDWRLGLAAAGYLVMIFGATVYNIAQVSFRQAMCPPYLLGRMNATMRFLVWGTLPIGGLVGGTLGSLVGVRPTLWIAAGGASLAFLSVFLSPLRSMRELPAYRE